MTHQKKIPRNWRINFRCPSIHSLFTTKSLGTQSGKLRNFSGGARFSWNVRARPRNALRLFLQIPHFRIQTAHIEGLSRQDSGCAFFRSHQFSSALAACLSSSPRQPTESQQRNGTAEQQHRRTGLRNRNGLGRHADKHSGIDASIDCQSTVCDVRSSRKRIPSLKTPLHLRNVAGEQNLDGIIRVRLRSIHCSSPRCKLDIS